MRDIKFQYIFKNNVRYIYKVYTISQIEKWLENICDCLDCELIAKRQYTWLKDKSWKEIYEGDVINFQYMWHHKTLVEFKKGGFFIRNNWHIEDLQQDFVITFAGQDKYHEIIWNIYENPKLIN